MIWVDVVEKQDEGEFPHGSMYQAASILGIQSYPQTDDDHNLVALANTSSNR